MYPPIQGGSGAFAYELSNALAARYHEVDVFTQMKPGTSQFRPVHENVSVHRIAKARRHLVTLETLYYSLRARRAVDFEEYDVVHGTLMPASTIALSDRLGIETPIVLTCHSLSLAEVHAHDPNRPADYMLKYVFHPMNVIMDTVASRRVEKIVAISSEMRRRLIQTYRLPPRRVEMIGHGVDVDRFRPVDCGKLDNPEDGLTLLFLGRLISRKGADIAIRTLAELESSGARLLVAGVGRAEPSLRHLVEKLNVGDRTEFLGYVPKEDLPGLYARANLMLFPPVYEGFGLVFLESMACGTPVVAPPVGGIPDVVTDGKDGCIVERTPDAIANRVRELKDDPDRLARMSTAARKTAEQHTWDVTAQAYERLYESVLETS